MATKKTVDSLIKPAGTIRGILKRKKAYHLADPDGEPVKVDYIKDHLLIKDYFVRQIAEIWVDIYHQLEHLKELLLAGGPAMYDYLAEADDVRSDSKGGFTEYDFGRNIKVVVSYDLRYDVDESMMKRSAAHMDRWLDNQGQGDLVKIVQKAFRMRNGKYDIKALNRLNELKIEDDNFTRAMELKNEAISSTPTKLRTQLYIRDRHGEFHGVPISLHDVDPAGEAPLGPGLMESRINPVNTESTQTS